ncbi:MAG: hypothetical protein HZA14_00295 [Nitrospirae bacterium]|nr:hypothetical protein [Nitrospirota bacterium]
MKIIFLVFTILLVVVSACAVTAHAQPVALLPFENFSNNKDALAYVMPALTAKLKEKGFETIDDESLFRFLCKERIRSTAYISKEQAQKAGEALGTKAILAGAVISFSSEENPQIGLLARLIDSSTGFILWADHAFFAGDDFAGILGLGSIKSIDGLTYKAVDRLLASFHAGPSPKEAESVYRIAVIPFQNKSKYRNAGMIATYMFLTELFRNQMYEPIEYGDVRKLVVEYRIINKGELDFYTIEALSRNLGVSGILLGTVEQYPDVVESSLQTTVAMTVRLLDARNNKILWYNTRQSNGGKAIIAFDWGETRTVDKIAYSVVSELSKKMKTAKWR